MGSQPSHATQTDDRRNRGNNRNHHTSRSPVETSRSYPQTVGTPRKRHPQDDSDWAESVQRKRHANDQLEWPGPPAIHYPPFHLNDNSDADRYGLTFISTDNTTPRTPTPTAKTVELYNEKDTSTADWKKQIDSKSVDSAHVQSQLSARFHACYNLAAADNIDVVMNGLKKTQIDLDDRLKKRLAKISAEAEQKISLIVEDTREEQKRLLAYDKEQQHRQDEIYQEWLQKYVVELNTWRSRELAKLQKDLLTYQRLIVDISKQKIERVNEEAHAFKTLILDEEKQRVSRKTNKLTSTMYDLTRDDTHFLGSESKTELNLRVQANVGRIAPGQSCTNGLDN